MATPSTWIWSPAHQDYYYFGYSASGELVPVFSRELVGRQSSAQEPTTQEPTTQEPTTQEPATQEPTNQEWRLPARAQEGYVASSTFLGRNNKYAPSNAGGNSRATDLISKRVRRYHGNPNDAYQVENKYKVAGMHNHADSGRYSIHQQVPSGDSGMGQLISQLDASTLTAAVSPNMSYPCLSRTAQETPTSYQVPVAERLSVHAQHPGYQQGYSYPAQTAEPSSRFIQTNIEGTIDETLDNRYRRVAKTYHATFFKPGRVFKMLWTEPAGQGISATRHHSTRFSTIWLGEQAFSEIRYFVVVLNKGTFSQCLPIQTYGKKGATKPGLLMEDHGIIYTTNDPPEPLYGEHLTKYSIKVIPNDGNECLDPLSRVNYGKAYAVEHNVKVSDVGVVHPDHRYLLAAYFNEAMKAE